MNPRRLTGRALQLSAKAAQVPLLATGVRAAGRRLTGVSDLRAARLGEVRPGLSPPLPTRSPAAETPAGAAELT